MEFVCDLIKAGSSDWSLALIKQLQLDAPSSLRETFDAGVFSFAIASVISQYGYRKGTVVVWRKQC